MKKFIIGMCIAVAMLFVTTPQANAAVHVTMPPKVHAYPHIYVTPCDNGVYQVWGVEQQADLLVYTLLYQGSC